MCLYFLYAATHPVMMEPKPSLSNPKAGVHKRVRGKALKGTNVDDSDPMFCNWSQFENMFSSTMWSSIPHQATILHAEYRK